MSKIYWTEPAVNDLQEIKEYIHKDSPRYAKIVEEKISQRPGILRKNLRAGRKVPEFNQDDIRELIYAPYRIIYQLRKNKVYIAAIIHSSRELTQHYKPDNDY